MGFLKENENEFNKTISVKKLYIFLVHIMTE